jgi:hypothetical protein
MKKIYPALCYGLLLLIGCNVQAAQIVSATTAHPFIAAGDTVGLTLRYQAALPETATETGLGLRIHYDSALLTPAGISAYPASLQPYGDATEDTDDFDNDPQTDRYFIVSWIDFNAQWPGNGLLPLTLLQLQFSVPDNPGALTYVGFSAAATAKNTAFQSARLALCPKPSVTVTANTNSVNEEQTTVVPRFIFQASQSVPAACGDLIVYYAAGGTASAGDDYAPLSGSITIPAGQHSAELIAGIIDDDRVEADETLKISLQSSQDYQLNNNTSATLTIKSADQTSVLPEVNLSAGKLTVTEGRGGSLLLFAERTTTNLTQPLEVLLELSGTATADDYQTFPDSITIPAGSSRAFAVLLLKDDGDQEADETLNIHIVASDNYQRGENSSLQLIIQDDELNQNTSLPVTLPAAAAAPQAASAAQQTGQETHQVPIPVSGPWLLLIMSLLLSGVATLRLRLKHRGAAA